MRIIGIDPGMAIIGYCILDMTADCKGEQYSIINSGSIQTSKKDDNSTRLLEIYNDLTDLVKEYKPDIAAVEEIFFFKNAKTIMPVSQARGVILMCLKKHNIPVYEYTPLVVKQTITGYGRANKDEIKQMIQIMLAHETIPKLDDTADAIAIALCHFRQHI